MAAVSLGGDILQVPEAEAALGAPQSVNHGDAENTARFGRALLPTGQREPWRQHEVG